MMNRIVWHHTGGAYRPNEDDLRAYHRLIDRDGAVHLGRHGIEANAPGRPLVSGRYAAHCMNLNSGSIGLSVCAMKDARWADVGRWTHPVLPGQIDALIEDTARLCLIFDIEPDRRFTLSHAEVEITLGVDQKAKWDFDYPPRGGPGARDAVAIGDELRQELRRAISALAQRGVVEPVGFPASRPVLRAGSTGAAVRELQGMLGVTVDGQFGPLTRAAVVAFQRARELLPDGIVGRMTWAALTA